MPPLFFGLAKFPAQLWDVQKNQVDFRQKYVHTFWASKSHSRSFKTSSTCFIWVRLWGTDNCMPPRETETDWIFCHQGLYQSFAQSKRHYFKRFYPINEGNSSVLRCFVNCNFLVSLAKCSPMNHFQSFQAAEYLNFYQKICKIPPSYGSQLTIIHTKNHSSIFFRGLNDSQCPLAS